MLALVGESGCGKTTTAQTILGMVAPDSGTVRLNGTYIALPERQMRPLRRQLQMIYQDPYESLDPRFRVETTVGEPLLAHGIGGKPAERRAGLISLRGRIIRPRRRRAAEPQAEHVHRLHRGCGCAGRGRLGRPGQDRLPRPVRRGPAARWVFTMAPRRWRAVVAEVPFVDRVTTMLDPGIPLTVGEWDEWGDPGTRRSALPSLVQSLRQRSGRGAPEPAGHREPA